LFTCKIFCKIYTIIEIFSSQIPPARLTTHSTYSTDLTAQDLPGEDFNYNRDDHDLTHLQSRVNHTSQKFTTRAAPTPAARAAAAHPAAAARPPLAAPVLRRPPRPPELRQSARPSVLTARSRPSPATRRLARLPPQARPQLTRLP